jgi:hypothetical protein
MKRIKSYNQFNRINEEEEISLKKAAAIGGLAAASLLPMSARGQSAQRGMGRDRDKVQVAKDSITRREITSDSIEAAGYMRRGFQLDSVVNITRLIKSDNVEKVWNTIQSVAPDTIVVEQSANFDAGKFFKSGYFNLDSTSKGTISEFIEDIMERGNIIAKVSIESSTDKQQLKQETKDRLENAGYEASNKGLSIARNDEIANFLTSEYGISDSLIERNMIVQGGTGTIDQSARYVKVTVDYINIESFVKEAEYKTDSIDTYLPKEEVVGKVYYLSKKIVPTKDGGDSSTRISRTKKTIGDGPGKAFNPKKIKMKSCPKVNQKGGGKGKYKNIFW